MLTRRGTRVLLYCLLSLLSSWPPWLTFIHPSPFRYIEELVKQEVDAGVPSDRIVVAGEAARGQRGDERGDVTNDCARVAHHPHLPSLPALPAGFSQGGASSLMMLRSDLKLAGIAGGVCPGGFSRLPCSSGPPDCCCMGPASITGRETPLQHLTLESDRSDLDPHSAVVLPAVEGPEAGGVRGEQGHTHPDVPR